MKKLIHLLLIALVAIGSILIYRMVQQYLNEGKVLKEVISRLEADSRIAEVLVTEVRYNEAEQKNYTTIKFLEYDARQHPLPARYFTFPGNIIQFQSLVIRFNDINVRMNKSLRNKSAYLFWKVFMLDGQNTREFKITSIDEVPRGYRVSETSEPFEQRLWEKFWEYALNQQQADKAGIKNAQIEAPGTMFIPGVIYTIKIEHDGGMRIDTQRLPPILKGERIPAE